MAEKKPRLVRMVSFDEIIIVAFITWVVEKLLDFLWQQGKARIRLEGEISDEEIMRASSHVTAMLSLPLVEFMATIIIPRDIEQKSDRYSSSLKDMLVMHKTCHKYLGNRSCGACSRISLYKKNLQKSVPESDLYPPFHSFDVDLFADLASASWRKRVEASEK